MAAVAAVADALRAAPSVERRITLTDLTFTGTYTTGGESLTAAALRLGSVDFALAVVTGPAASVTSAVYDLANAKLKLFTSAAQVANAVDHTALTVRVIAFGSA